MALVRSLQRALEPKPLHSCCKEQRWRNRRKLELHSWRKLLTGRTDYRRMWRALRYRIGGGRPAQDERSAELEATVQGARPELMAFFARALPTLSYLIDRFPEHSLEG